ncbi:hypothetical protein G314FT_02660 [Vagococcus luciliae]|uniref:Uncharacterized protein n=1 Tax=Vagococcus luciliae TaxID=2920380 RepID=A0ABY5NX10_9ENTE|nr:hypothetical protein [Vagococcus luciliae]UUV98175.1 hypothetical protein G314FT_02660 [Vagococcus luciliae]
MRLPFRYLMMALSSLVLVGCSGNKASQTTHTTSEKVEDKQVNKLL